MPNLPRVVDKARRLAELVPITCAGARPGRRARSGAPATASSARWRRRRPAGRPLLPGHRWRRRRWRLRPPRRRADRHGRAVAYTLHRVAGEVLRLAHRARARNMASMQMVLGRCFAIHRRARHVAEGAADPAPHPLRTAFNRLPRAGLRAGRAAAEAGRRGSPGRGAGGVQSRCASTATGGRPARPCGTCCRCLAPTRCRPTCATTCRARSPQSTAGDRAAAAAHARRPQRGRRSLTRSRSHAGRGAGRQRGPRPIALFGDDASRLLVVAVAAIAKMRSARTAQPSPNASAS